MGGKGPPEVLRRQELLLHRRGFQPMTGWAIQARGQNLRYINDATQGMMTHSPNDACKTRTTEATMIVKGASTVLMGLA
jgi:hypothetical protein